MASTVPVFFETPARLRKWFETNHAKVSELWIGFYKKGTGRPSVTYHEALDEALCFGWIDGVRKTIDTERYTQRFTPRRKGSYWSAVNTRRANELKKRGLMKPSGLAAFEARDAERTKRYSRERETAAFPPELERKFRANARAWAFFEKQPPGCRKLAAIFVMTAKREETKLARLERLIRMSAEGRRLT
jgi:uncharacterized protein YdeI (YjbR/CyaY-like superfamily)